MERLQLKRRLVARLAVTALLVLGTRDAGASEARLAELHYERDASASACADAEELRLINGGWCLHSMDMMVAREWLVTLTEDVTEVDAVADALAARHGFAVGARLGVLRSFIATMTTTTIAQLGREPYVRSRQAFVVESTQWNACRSRGASLRISP